MSHKNKNGLGTPQMIMTSPILPHDVVMEVINYLENDHCTLHSCILVNRLWCQTAIEVFWKNLWEFRIKVGLTGDTYRFWGAVFRTLTSCLSDSSKELLRSNGIKITLYTPKVQLFDYPAYLKSLDCVAISAMIEMVTYMAHQHERPRRLLYIQHLLEQEICKMFINKCGTIPVLILDHIPLAYFPGAQECFSSLTELRCHTAVHETIFFAMAQLCRNIERIVIEFFDDDNLGLAALIEMQQHNLKYVKCLGDELGEDQKFGAIVDVFRKNANFYTQLDLVKFPFIRPVTITTMMNLQSLTINLIGSQQEEAWEELANAYLPKLEVLHLHFDTLSLNVTKNIIANNNGGLYSIIVDYEPDDDDQSVTLNETIVQYCPKLKFLATWFLNNEWNALADILMRCQDLECLTLQGTVAIQIDGDKLLNLLRKEYTPKGLWKLGLRGSWVFSKKTLRLYLKDCKEKKKRIAFCFSDNDLTNFNDINDIFEKYYEEGVIRWYKFNCSFEWDSFCT
ncbi:9628_t:CDS:1 [Funneliformis caledonium]|uniref:9628_t:CDS:1 n=1 Tax=Funneliformis caledonium TaxID=1117310 RepID=A0A9N9C278_9GLOM|nr:9628_t:CDS:1 [Funneliformis caledonium]